MNLEIEITQDGSHTLFLPQIDEHYHSIFGAINESRHVYIENGLKAQSKHDLNILEIGFGTGLNAFLSLLEAENTGRKIHLTTLELFPLPIPIAEKLNFAGRLGVSDKWFRKLHRAEWNTAEAISENFTLEKRQTDLTSLPLLTTVAPSYDVIFYDAFAPEKQPEMWTQAIFNHLFAASTKGAVLTTYCAKGIVRRMMQHAGFAVERIPGPTGKREMLRARKP